MSSEHIIRECKVADGVKAVIQDMSSHYYGGYYHVRLQITAEIPLSDDWFDSDSEYEDAIRLLGSTVCFKRLLEKMAVPENEVDSTRQSLLVSFENNVLPYLSRTDFPRRFALSEYEKACKSPAVNAYYHP